MYLGDNCKLKNSGFLNEYTYTYMFRVYLNPKEARVLVTKAKVEEKDWVLVGKYSTWDKAYRKALYLASRLDYVLEWYLEDQLESILQIFKN